MPEKRKNNSALNLSAELRRRGQSIIREHGITLCRETGGGISAALPDPEHPETLLHLQINGIETKDLCCTCDCGTKAEICEHAAAVILHYLRHCPPRQKKTDDDSPAYRGIRAEPLLAAADRIRTQTQAELSLRVHGEPPHAASKWENLRISVELHSRDRNYLGNLTNLRQIHFRESLGGKLRISQFPSQDRQIIRFLAVNAEADGSQLALTAEQAAEFFHCLAGFSRFYWQKQHLMVHSEPAEPVLLYHHTSKEISLRPAIQTNSGFLALKNTRLIMGRAGCWIGTEGEYWWLPGVLDLIGMRNFFRAGEEKINPEDINQFLLKYANTPVSIVPAEQPDSHDRTPTPVYTLSFIEGKLMMNLKFDYQGTVTPGKKANPSHENSKYWRRDQAAEKIWREEILRYGFQPGEGTDNRFELHDCEAVGAFIDKIIPGWLEEKREVLLSAAVVQDHGLRIPDLRLHCRMRRETETHFELNYELIGNDQLYSWQELSKATRQRRSYLAAQNGLPVRIPETLSRLIEATAGIIRPAPRAKGVLRVPRTAIFQFSQALGKLKISMPRKLAQMVHKLKPHHDEKSPLSIPGFHGQLRPYQAAGVKWLKRMTDYSFNPVLADEMGLGKTIQALALMAERQMENYPDLLVCPSSLVENWKHEAGRFVPSLSVLAMHVGKRQEQWKKLPDIDLVICSYALIRQDIKLFKQQLFRYVILDEAQHIKNPGTVNAKTCKALRAEKRLVLTGTPLENRPEDLWSLFDFLNPGMLGSFRSFRRRYSNGEKHDELAARVGPLMLRRQKKDVAKELPEKIEQVYYCEMGNTQRQLYEDLLTNARKTLHQQPGKKRFELLTQILRMRQLCCHPALLPEKLRKTDSPSAKTELLQELLYEAMDSGSRVLVFSQFTSLLKIVREWLEKQQINYEYIDGNSDKRQEKVDRFNRNQNIPVFLLSLKAGGFGFNLTGADRVVIYDPWWNPAVEAQAADRTHRIGQQRQVCSMKLVVKNSIEEKILAMQEDKQQLFNDLVSKPSAILKNLSDEDLEFLFAKE